LYIIAIPLTFTYLIFVQNIYSQLPKPEIDALTSLSETQADKMLFDIQLMFYLIVIGAILLVIVYFLALCFSQGLVFSKLVSKKDLSWQFFKKFALLNLLLVIVIIPIWIVLSFAIRVSNEYLAASIFILGLLVILSIITTIYYFFTKKQELNAIQHAFSYLSTNIKKLSFHLIAALVIFGAIMLLNYGVYAIASPTIVQIFSLLSWLWYLTWFTIYYVKSIHE
ncbi:MAG: hypothetical protein QW331_03915, partial [Candidatus Woesearchaeota archaeon]